MLERQIPHRSRTIRLACDKAITKDDYEVGSFQKIRRYLEGERPTIRDRLYGKAELRQIISHCDERTRAIFLVLISTCAIIGVFPELKLGEIQKIENFES